MTDDQIRALLAFRDAPEKRCDQVNVLLDEHIGHVARRIGELSALERELKDLRNQCQGIRTARDCGIIQSLGHGTGRASSRRQTPVGYVALTGSAEHSEQLMR